MRYQRQGFVPTLLYVAFYAFARLSITSTTRLQLLVRAIALGATPVGVYAVGQRLGVDPIWDDLPQDRVFSTIGQPNSLGAFFAMTIPLTVGAAATVRRPLAFGYAASAVVQFVGLLLTISRGGFLGVFVAGLILAFGGLRVLGWPWRRIVPTIAAGAVIAVLLGAVSPIFDSTAGRAFDRVTADDEWATGSIRTHIDLWHVSVHMIGDHPITGTGPDTYPVVFGEYRDDVLSPADAALLVPYRVESPHNVYLATATGSGVPAALVFTGAILVGLAVAGGIATSSPDRTGRLLGLSVLAALAAHVVTDLFITAELTGSWLAWILLGAVVGTKVNRPSPEIAGDSTHQM